MIDIIDRLQEDIFKYEMQGVNTEISSLIGGITRLMAGITHSQTATLNEILKYITTGMQNQDYLLVADILEYELKPFIKGLSDGKGDC